eukprot:g13339.t1
MPKAITVDLIRRKAEHNEGLIHTLEELSLHQEELESIDDTLGCNCRRLKILYLQNNIIGEMKNLHHMKELEYLNLALNNITKVEGLQSCEFLNKLDLTVNFIDLDELESSVNAMEGNRHLGDLYMMGNPCQSWSGFEAYVIARLPQLERLDGKEITRTARIKAQQRLPTLREEIIPLAEEVRQRKRVERQAAGDGDQEQDQDNKHDGDKAGGREGAGGGSGSGNGQPPAPGKHDGTAAAATTTAEDEGSMAKASSGSGGDKGSEGVIGEEELTKHTPEVRTAIYREMAEQKKEKEDRQRENLPKDRDFELEQAAAVEKARQREAEGAIRQCNEGRLEFRFEETRAGYSSPERGMGAGGGLSGRGGRVAGCGGGGRSSSGDIVLEVAVPKYLDSSLIDLDVHPHYVSIVIKGKVLRLSLQAEVRAGEAKARRSKTTGSLVVTMPKVDPHQSIGLIPTSSGRRAPGVVADRQAASKSAAKNDVGRTKRRGGGAPTLAAQMLEEAQAAAAAKRSPKGGGGVGGSGTAVEGPREAVSIRGMVGPRHGGLAVEETAPQLTEVTSMAKRAGASSATDNNGSGDGTNNACTTAAAAFTETPPRKESPVLPTPPSSSKSEPPRQSGGKATCTEPVPPAPPSGGSVPLPREGGAGAGVVWPAGLGEDEDLSRLEELD